VINCEENTSKQFLAHFKVVSLYLYGQTQEN